MFHLVNKWTSRIFPVTNFTPVLGRWSNEIDSKRKNTRIDWANEDHCGACGNPFKDKIHIQNLSDVHEKSLQNETLIDCRNEPKQPRKFN